MIYSFFLSLCHAVYKKIFRPIFFLFSSENIHDKLVSLGEFFGRYAPLRGIISALLSQKNSMLQQTVAEIQFKSPLGLSAGFDYQAQLMSILPSIGFGFETIGTITNLPYEGNPSPHLEDLLKLNRSW